MRRMLTISTQFDCARLRSCVGATAGPLFTTRALASGDGLAVDDEAFASAVRWRLGMDNFAGPAGRCKRCPGGGDDAGMDAVQTRSARGECGQRLDRFGDRPRVLCQGAGFKVRHDPIVEQVSHSSRDRGCQSRVERSLAGVFQKKGNATSPGRLGVNTIDQA